MAVTIHTGMLNRKVVFQKPTMVKGNQGDLVTTYADEITTFACVREVSQRRAMEPNGSTLTDGKEFIIRYAANRAAITKDWRIVYSSLNWVINEVEPLNEGSEWLRLRAKAVGPAQTFTVADTGGGGTAPPNYPSLFYGYNTNTGLVDFNFPSQVNIDDNAASIEVTVGANEPIILPPDTSAFSASLTGDTLVKWRRFNSGGYSSFGQLSVVENLTIGRQLAYNPDNPNNPYEQGGVRHDVELVFPVIVCREVLLNAYGAAALFVDIGIANTVAEYVAMWNADTVNAARGQIVSYEHIIPSGGGAVPYWSLTIELLPFRSFYDAFRADPPEYPVNSF